MLTALINWMAGALETALVIDVTKGWPLWYRNPLVVAVLPAGALLLRDDGNNLTKRVGQAAAQRQAQFDFYLYCQNDYELCTKLDALNAWYEQNAAAIVLTNRVYVVMQNKTRQINENGLQQEEHAFYCPFVISW